MLYIDLKYQGKDYGRSLIQFWENGMKSKSYEMLIIPTQVNENSQNFYRKLGYKDYGGFIIDNPKYS